MGMQHIYQEKNKQKKGLTKALIINVRQRKSICGQNSEDFIEEIERQIPIENNVKPDVTLKSLKSTTLVLNKEKERDQEEIEDLIEEKKSKKNEISMKRFGFKRESMKISRILFLMTSISSIIIKKIPMEFQKYKKML